MKDGADLLICQDDHGAWNMITSQCNQCKSSVSSFFQEKLLPLLKQKPDEPTKNKLQYAFETLLSEQELKQGNIVSRSCFHTCSAKKDKRLELPITMTTKDNQSN